MTITACAELVRQGDPDRFLATMAAPPACRAPLFVLYAFNLEIARAPYLTDEPMIAEMRLQWWADVVAAAGSGAARAHEVAAPLHALIAAGQVDPGLLQEMIAARRWDCWREPHADQAALLAYLGATGGALMQAAAQATAGNGDARGIGTAAALAAYLVAAPTLAAKGRVPLPDDAPEALRALASAGLAFLAPARGPACLVAWQARPILRQVQRDPGAVAEGRLGLSEFARRARLIWCAARGRV